MVVALLRGAFPRTEESGSGIRERSEREAGARSRASSRRPARRAGTVVADVMAVDPKRQTITLRGPKRTVDLKVKDPKQLKLGIGDQSRGDYTEALAVSVEPAPKMKK